jgi:hypothetical protein
VINFRTLIKLGLHIVSNGRISEEQFGKGMDGRK